MKWWVTFYLAISLALATPSFAAESLKTNGAPQVRLQFSIIIPQRLSLQIGSEDLALGAADSKTGETRGIPVKAAGWVAGKQSIILTANAAGPMSEYSRTSPLEKVPQGGPADLRPVASTGGNNGRVDHLQGSRNRNGGYAFNHIGDKNQLAGNHAGPVIYTVSSP